MFPGKPQIPPLKPNGPTREWKDIQRNFQQATEQGQVQTLYLQSYLGKLQQWMVPLQSTVMPVAQGQSPYPVGSNDTFIGASASATLATEVDLPQAVGSGRMLIIAKMDSNAHNVNVKPNGSDTINGGGTVGLTTQYDVVRLIDAATAIWIKW